ncbi:MAG: hypothetical protein JXB10_00725 [Pirellulales bacterium]|nr:hypothetical protein [Pirellulales bacterium]
MSPILEVFLAAVLAAGADKPFAIEVVDRQTGRGVPLVELTTVNQLRYFTDSNGLVAFAEPGLMHTKVFFSVKSHGYEFPQDGFGIRGKTLEIAPGGTARLEIDRINLARRLYRITGGGIYADSVRLGRPVPIREPLLNGQVFGCDGAVSAEYRGKIYWFRGDTSRPSYPLGNFKTTGATSDRPGRGGLDPDVGIDLHYFVDPSGFVKEMVPLPSPGPIWIGGLVVLRDGSGRERMFAHYVKVQGTTDNFHAAGRGLIEYDDATETFRHVAAFPKTGPDLTAGHALLHKDQGVEYVYFCDPFPRLRVRAGPESLKNPAAYEVYTCLTPGAERKEKSRFDRAADGALRWAWRAGGEPLGPIEAEKLIRAGKMRAEESPFTLRDARTGKPVVAHRGSVAWNDYRRRWIMIFCEMGGSSSMLGEIWYAEAEDLRGPWVSVRKIVTHDRYSFYNPKHHSFFDQQGGRVIYFEGTYTAAFSGNTDPTPRYDYNQIMYRLDLAEICPQKEGVGSAPFLESD